MTFLILTALCAGVFFYLEADSKGVKPLKWVLLATGSIGISCLVTSVAISLVAYFLGFGGKNFFVNKSLGFLVLLISLWPIRFLYRAFSKECAELNSPANQSLEADD